MDEKNELNDIILDKSSTTNKNKKIVFAAATFGVVLIGVILFMSTLSDKSQNNLPEPIMDEPEINPYKTKTTKEPDPLFEDVEVIEEKPSYDTKLDAIAQKLKKESQQQEDFLVEEEVVEEPVVQKRVTPKPQPVVKKVVHKPQPKQVVHKQTKAPSGHYFVQVGSFAKYKPNKKFLNSITSRGYNYKFHKVNVKSKVINKILIGPFQTEKEARKALKNIRQHIEKGAFLTKI